MVKFPHRWPVNYVLNTTNKELVRIMYSPARAIKHSYDYHVLQYAVQDFGDFSPIKTEIFEHGHTVVTWEWPPFVMEKACLGSVSTFVNF